MSKALHLLLTSPPVSEAKASSLSATGLPFAAILAALEGLLPVIGADLPALITAIVDIVAAIKAPGGFTWASISALMVKDAPAIEAVVTAIAAALKISIPTAPAAA